jgi:hypothetical protein
MQRQCIAKRGGWITVALLLFFRVGMAQDMPIDVHFTQELGPFVPFMNSTGHASAELELDENYQRNTVYLGSIPYGEDGMLYHRIHGMLNLIEVQNHWEGEPQYNWARFDSVLDHMVAHGMKPILELIDFPMGSWQHLPDTVTPAGRHDINFFEDFVHPVVVYEWREFIEDLATHLIDRYGRNEVRSWYFEIANEPGVTAIYGCWENNMVGEVVRGDTLTMENICGIMLANKFDAEEAGLHAVDSMLQYGGTGGGMDEPFLPHVARGENFFTGDSSGTRVDFLSIRHIKSTWDKSVGNATYWHAQLQSDFPELAGTPLMHTEDDWYYPWGSQGGMRASAAYPTMIATKMLLYQYAARLGDNTGGEPVNFVLSSPDNGFLGWWGNRTLMQQFNDDAQEGPVYLDPTDPNKANAIELIKKPAFNGMVLMSLLGDTHIEADGYTSDRDDGVWDLKSPYFAEVLATKDNDDRVAAMVLNCRRNYMYCEDQKKTVSLTFHDLPFDSAVVAHYRIDSAHSNTFALWQRMGGAYTPPTCTANVKVEDLSLIGYQGPVVPTAEQFATLRSRQELEYLDQQPPEKVTITGGTYTTEFTLPMPGVSMVVLSPKPENPPADVQNIQVTERPYNMTDERHMMVSWDDMYNKHIQTYEVLYSETENGTYTRVNEPDLLCTAFMHVKPAGSPDGYYKVRAVDYWGRESDSTVVPVSAVQQSVAMTHEDVAITVQDARLMVNNPFAQPVRVQIFNAMGRQCMHRTVDAGSSAMLMTARTALSGGVYYVRVRSADNTLVKSRRIVRR